MNLTKGETNNAIIVKLENVRKHPNADRLKLATVLGTTVVVGLDANDGDLVIYFDSNLRLSEGYLKSNNLYSEKSNNADPEKKGYFGNNGRVRAQRFRGEMSNGYVAPINSLWPLVGVQATIMLKEGDEFTHVNDVEVCRKYIIPRNLPGEPGSRNRTRKRRGPVSDMFKPHWDTKQLMRANNLPGTTYYIEEKVHGTSGRTGNVLVNTYRPWYKFWVPKQKWSVISGTRRVEHIGSHMPVERREVENILAPNLHKGETVYYEIFGYQKNGSPVQSGFPYGCRPGEYKVMLYRVTITTPDGFTIDLPREAVYHRAEELGLLKPHVYFTGLYAYDQIQTLIEMCSDLIHGNSAWDNHMREGVVVWYQERDGSWTCLKYKSDEFYLKEDTLKEQNIGDVEDSI